MGPGSQKPPVERGARRAKGRRRRRPARQESTLEIMDRLLSPPVPISMNGQAKQVSASEAIVLQLMQKAMSGNARAWRALLKYQEFANSRSDKIDRTPIRRKRLHAGSREIPFEERRWLVTRSATASRP